LRKPLTQSTGKLRAGFQGFLAAKNAARNDKIGVCRLLTVRRESVTKPDLQSLNKKGPARQGQDKMFQLKEANKSATTTYLFYLDVSIE
jgi:hypothetical protein